MAHNNLKDDLLTEEADELEKELSHRDEDTLLAHDGSNLVEIPDPKREVITEDNDGPPVGAMGHGGDDQD